MQRLVRNFGLLSASETPCGQQLPVSEAHALMVLLERAEVPPTLSELCEELGLDKSNVTRLAQRLERAGLIGTRPCPDDGRAKRVELTRLGKRRAQAVSASSRAEFAAVLRQLPSGSQADVLASLWLLADAMKKRAAQ